MYTDLLLWQSSLLRLLQLQLRLLVGANASAGDIDTARGSTVIIGSMRPFLMIFLGYWTHLYCFVLVVVETVPVCLAFELHSRSSNCCHCRRYCQIDSWKRAYVSEFS